MRRTRLVLPPTLSRLAVVAAGWPRRVLATLLLLSGAVLLWAKPAESRASLADVVVAADGARAGTILSAQDLRLARWPADLVPEGALRTTAAALGKRLAGAVSAGEALTATRLLDTAISSALRPGQVAVSVTLRDAAQTAILQAGARVDLYVAESNGLASPDPPAGAPVAMDVQILAVLAPSATGQQGASTSSGPASVVIACPEATAAQLARVTAGAFVASLKPD